MAPSKQKKSGQSTKKTPKQPAAAKPQSTQKLKTANKKPPAAAKPPGKKRQQQKKKKNYSGSSAKAAAQPGTSPVVDWSRTITFNPKKVIKPLSIDDLARALESESNATPFTVLGSRHSCSDIFKNSNGTLIDTSGLPKNFQLSDDLETLTVSANLTLRDINQRLALQGRSLPATGGTDEQTLAGVMGTNTAPATKTVRMYDTITSIRYMTFIDNDTRTAVIKEVRRGEDSNFKAFICNMGALGVVLRVTMDTSKDKYFETVQFIEGVVPILQNNVIKNDEFAITIKGQKCTFPFWRIDWVPETDQGLVWAARSVQPKPTDNPDGDYPTDLTTTGLKWANHIGNWLGETPLITEPMKTAYKVAISGYPKKPQSKDVISGPLRNMLPVDRFTAKKMYCTMAEWAFVPSDALTVQGIVKDHFKKEKWPNLPVEIELTQTDDYPMSPFNFQPFFKGEQQPPYVVKFNFMYLSPDRPKPAFRGKVVDHLRDLWEKLKDRGLRFKGHWGKVNFTKPADVQDLYGWDEVKPLVREQFMNPYLEEKLPSLRS